MLARILDEHTGIHFATGPYRKPDRNKRENENGAAPFRYCAVICY